MDRRLVIAISGSSAAIVLAVGLTAAGFSPGARPSAAAESLSIAAEPVAADETEKPATAELDIVYVKPAPKPRTIVVKRSATGISPASKTRSRKAAPAPTRRVSRSASRREHESERRSELREHLREQEAERRKEAEEQARERERGREREREGEDD